MLSPSVLEILVCPKSKQPLVYFPEGEDGAEDGFLLAIEARLRYRIDHGVPVLLVEEAETLSPAETARLVERAKALGLRLPT